MSGGCMAQQSMQTTAPSEQRISIEMAVGLLKSLPPSSWKIMVGSIGRVVVVPKVVDGVGLVTDKTEPTHAHSYSIRTFSLVGSPEAIHRVFRTLRES